MEEPVISEAAEGWIWGGLDSSEYFAQARRLARERARVEVELRLRRNSRRSLFATVLAEVESRSRRAGEGSS